MSEYWRHSTSRPDPDRIADRVQCRAYDATCDCPACTDDRAQGKPWTGHPNRIDGDRMIESERLTKAQG